MNIPKARRAGAVAIFALLVIPSLFAAQEWKHSPGPDDGRVGRMIPALRIFGPAMILKHREALGLTDVQVRRLEEIAAAEFEAIERHKPPLIRAVADLMEAASRDVDLQAARTALDRLAGEGTDLVMVHLQAKRDALQVLTPEQRTRLEAMAMKMHGKMGFHGMMDMHGMMGGHGCPMMRHGGEHGAMPGHPRDGVPPEDAMPGRPR